MSNSSIISYHGSFLHYHVSAILGVIIVPRFLQTIHLGDQSAASETRRARIYTAASAADSKGLTTTCKATHSIELNSYKDPLNP